MISCLTEKQYLPTPQTPWVQVGFVCIYYVYVVLLLADVSSAASCSLGKNPSQFEDCGSKAVIPPSNSLR